MSKTIFNKIIAKFEKLDEYLKCLHEIQKVNKKTFLADYHCYGLAERYLQLAIEVILDVGKLMIVYQNLRRPEDNQDIFVVLADKKILSSRLTEKFSGIAGFRNILVHDYEKIDREIVYEKLKKNLEYFKDFKKAVLKYLK